MTSWHNITDTSMRRILLFLLVLLAIFFIGFLDYITGPEIGFAIFYLLPILFATWFLGKKSGIIFSLCSACMWFLADILHHNSNVYSIIPIWNALMRMGIFAIMSLIFSRIRQIDNILEERVRIRNGSLKLSIAERDKALESLLESEAEYRDLVENAVVGIYKTSLDGTIIFVNKTLAEIFEFNSPEEMISQNIFSFYKNQLDRSSLLEQLNKKGKLNNYEFEAVTKSGNNRIMLLSATLNDNTISGMIRDISEMKMMEQQLVESQKLEGIGTLAGGIAHDFNNILSIIIGYTTILQDKMANTIFSHNIDAINKVAARGAVLVNQLLTFARKSEIVLKPVQINNIVRELIILLEETFPKTIIVLSELDDNLPIISADHNQVYQVLMNICINARDAMHDKGTLRIITTLKPASSISPKSPKMISDKYVQVEVADTGTGIDAETQRRVFEPFFTTKEIGKGTGLGLAVAFGIMENHQGFIDLKSKLGQGSSFSLYFPIDSCIHEISESERQDNNNALNGNETILFIEDELLLLDCMKTCLENAGYKFIEAEDGEQAIKIFQEYRSEIDLVVADIGLPKINGYQVYKLLREINPSIKCLLVSGNIDVDKKSEVIQAGVIAIIQKPYMPKDILKHIRIALDTEQNNFPNNKL